MRDHAKIVIAGDSHCHYDHMDYLVRYAQSCHATAIVHLGDLGTDAKFLSHVSHMLTSTGLELYWIMGNHDATVLSEFNDYDDPTEILPHVMVLPTGFSWEWSGVRFMSLGGAYTPTDSRDEHWRPEHDVPQTRSLLKTIQKYDHNVEILISHDTIGHSSRRERLDTLFPFAVGHLIYVQKPLINFAGHWHERYLFKHDDTFVFGLGAYDGDYDESVQYLDLSRFDDLRGAAARNAEEFEMALAKHVYGSRTAHEKK